MAQSVEQKLQRLESIVSYAGHNAIIDRVHANFAQHAQANHRWSITDPPLATVPADLRDLWQPDPGWPWISWDWDGQELRIIAALSGDKPLLEVFNHDYDPHTLNCCDLFSLPYPANKRNPHTSEEDAGWRAGIGWQGKDDLRRVFAKRFVYRLNYGGDPRTAGDIPGAKALGLTPTGLVAASRAFLRAHPSLAAWRRRTEDQARKTKLSRDFAGRRRMLHANGAKVIRDAFDAPMQIGGVTILVTTAIAIKQRWGEQCRLAYAMHDSMKWAFRADIVEAALPDVKAMVDKDWVINGHVIRMKATFDDIRYAPEDRKEAA